MFGKRRVQPWQMTSLEDYWRVLLWMQEQRDQGKTAQGLQTFFRHLSENLLEGVGRYRAAVLELDRLSGGMYSAADSAAKANLKYPQGQTLLSFLEKLADELESEFKGQLEMAEAKLAKHWTERLSSSKGYVTTVSRVVQEFGNFEPLVMTLPGVGPIPTNPEVQKHLIEMYRVNTRGIRMFELAQDLLKAWGKGEATHSFFQPQTDLGQMAKKMLMEYMVESDPKRVEQKKRQAKAKGRPFSRYRFWRPAETYRQLAAVTYDNSPQRRPKPTRPYVDMKIDRVDPICADAQRLEWSIKEVFNNAIAATSSMNIENGSMKCAPLGKHASENQPAIMLRVQSFAQRKGWFGKQQIIRLTIEDVGIGMVDELARNAPLWAYSTRRAKVDNRLQPFDAFHATGAQDLIIGGKGIGLAFATATIRELGGELTIHSGLDQGTKVHLDVPTPSPHVDA